jgi:hypothetical protein
MAQTAAKAMIAAALLIAAMPTPELRRARDKPAHRAPAGNAMRRDKSKKARRDVTKRAVGPPQLAAAAQKTLEVPLAVLRAGYFSAYHDVAPDEGWSKPPYPIRTRRALSVSSPLAVVLAGLVLLQ